MESEEMLCKFRNVMKKLNYPNINAMNDEEYAEVFIAENRPFLVNWLAKQLCSNFESALEQTGSKQQFLQELFCHFGFCSSSQKIAFVTGSSTLGVIEQINIFNRIFSFLNAKDGSINLSATPNLEELNSEQENLFPEFGPIRMSRNTARINQFYDLISDAARASPDDENDEHDDDDGILNGEYKAEMTKNIAQFSEAIRGFVGRNEQPMETNAVNNNNNNNNETLNRLNEAMQTYLQYISDVDAISKLDNTEPKLPKYENEMTKMVVRQASLAEEIQESLKFFGEED